ncbi:fimbrial protein [Pseudomonas vranovensis]|uniref:fimbrial protein n=1 Tax=Pseudomonas vranovensis TaxID=321661 RepID=UPI003D988E4F
MNKRIFALALSLPLLAGITLNAQATDGLIDFTGSISGTTCTINGGPGGQNFTIPMGAAHTSEFTTAGSIAQPRPFEISLTNCVAGSTGEVDIQFLGGANVQNGRLNMDAGPNSATGVQYQLLNQAGVPIIIGGVEGGQNTVRVELVDGAATLRYTSQYYASAATVTPGAANSRVQYVINLP